METAVKRKKVRLIAIVALVFVIAVSIAAFIYYKSIAATRPARHVYQSLDKMKAVFDKFDTYRTAVFPDLDDLQLADREWAGIFYGGYGLFKRTEPTGYLISGYKNESGVNVHYSVKCKPSSDFKFVGGANAEYRGQAIAIRQPHSDVGQSLVFIIFMNSMEYQIEGFYFNESVTAEQAESVNPIVRERVEDISHRIIDQSLDR